MEGGEGSGSRRRRGAGVVTSNACTECRKKRAKCDGKSPCLRCLARSAECVYEVPVRQSKETMRAGIERLQTHRQQSERVFSAMYGGPYAQETLNLLRNGETLDRISGWLKKMASTAPSSSKNVTSYPSTSARRSFEGTLQMTLSVGSYASAQDNQTPNLPGAPRSSLSFMVSNGNPLSLGVPEAEDCSSDVDSFSNDPHQPSDQHSPQVSPLVGSWADHQGSKTAEVCSSDVASFSNDARRPSDRHDPRIGPVVGSWADHQGSKTEEDALQSARRRGQQFILGLPSGAEESRVRPLLPSSIWTKVTGNDGLVDHLMTLYFCWEYPIFASLLKEQFLADFRTGEVRYCSSVLVNAMLALGCRFSNLPEAFEDPQHPETSGNHFFAEAKRLLAQENYNSITTIQSLGLMSIREASCGRDSESYYYSGQAIRLAVELGLHFGVTEEDRASSNVTEQEVRGATFWGAFSLDQAWNMHLGRLPNLSRCCRLVVKPIIIEEIESSEWLPYTDRGAPEVRSANQPSNVRSVYRCFCELSELVHQSLYILYTPGRHLTSNELLTIYTRYLNWYSSLPEALRLGHNFTPAVLFEHIYYHCAILLLFRPFMKLHFIGSGVFPRDVCSQAADAITTLVRSYDQLYTLQRTPSFVPYLVLSSSIMHLVLSNTSNGLRQLHQDYTDLKDMCTCHGFAKRGLHILRFLSWQWGIKVGNALSGGRDDDGNSTSEDYYKQLCRPVSTSMNLFCPNFDDVQQATGPDGPSPLFTPFLLQGLPILAVGKKLEQDGFTWAF